MKEDSACVIFFAQLKDRKRMFLCFLFFLDPQQETNELINKEIASFLSASASVSLSLFSPRRDPNQLSVALGVHESHDPSGQ
jgi:hypothetical protein